MSADRPVEGRLEEVIPEGLDGERVDRVVAMLSDLSRSAVSRLITAGAVMIDGSEVTVASRRVIVGEVVVVDVPAPADPRPAADPEVIFEVVYEDDAVVVVNKPAGLVVHPGAGHREATLVNGLVARYPEVADVGEPHRPGVVHRLDRGTSGLLVISRTREAYDSLVGQMSARVPERAYQALVWGHPDRDAGTIEAPIGRSTRQPTRMAISENGRRAVTHYGVLQRYDEPQQVALLACRLETGRTHQIRVHLRAIGHPVVGDRDYGGGRPGLDPGRPFLHAGMLGFDHPETGERIEFTAPLPTDLADTLARCSVASG